jgi:hypothetical protein
MKSENKCALLADEILKILGGGLNLSRDVVHYIDSTFSNPSIEALQAILLDDSNCEKDSLIDLLLFPDEPLQLKLEDLLESQNYQKEDEEIVLRHLCRNPLHVSFHYPEKPGFFSLTISVSHARQFIRRLNIGKQQDSTLISAIETSSSEKHQRQFKVKIRNSRFSSTENNVRFLSAFFDRIDTEGGDVFECLDFVLCFLEELKDDSDIFRALMSKKKFYLRHLKRSQKFEEQLQKSNIEILLLQGKRAAFIDQKEARNKMAVIDRISRAVYGKTETIEPLRDGDELIEITSEQDVADIVKILS